MFSFHFLSRLFAVIPVETFSVRVTCCLIAPSDVSASDFPTTPQQETRALTAWESYGKPSADAVPQGIAMSPV
jgi:hypothetical protein